MFKFSKILAVVGVTSVLVLGIAPAAYASTAPTASLVILDEANLFTDNQEDQITAEFARLDTNANLKFAVETVTQVPAGQDIQAVALDRANALGLGDANKDNGVFLFISRDDREIRVELGAGVTGKVSDEAVQRIIATNGTPFFRVSNYTNGVLNVSSGIGREFSQPVVVSEDALGVNVSDIVMFILLFLVIAGIIVWAVVDYRHRTREADARERWARGSTA
jgi:uncharacterized protein